MAGGLRLTLLALPVAGLIGWGALAWRIAAIPTCSARTLGAALPAVAAIGLLRVAGAHRPGGADAAPSPAR